MSAAGSYRIGVLGLSHDHVWDHLPHLMSSPAVELVGAAEPRSELRERLERDIGCPAMDSYDQLLEQELQAVYIFADNRTGAELAIQSAERGLHVLIEKPMADTLPRADAMLAAATENATRLMVNWPFAWWPQLRCAVAAALDGMIGDVWQVRYRAAHAGPRELGCSDAFCEWLFDPHRNGAGALMDYCCYGALLASVVLGLPSRVSAVAGRLTKHEILVEDNAIVVMEYSDALAVSEGSWSQIGKLSSYVTLIYGTAGTLLVEPRVGGRLLLADADFPEGRELEAPELEEDETNATAHFASRLGSDEPLIDLCEPLAARDAQEILQAALQAARSGAAVSLPLPRV